MRRNRNGDGKKKCNVVQHFEGPGASDIALNLQPSQWLLAAAVACADDHERLYGINKVVFFSIS
jgi:hypothetical protein